MKLKRNCIFFNAKVNQVGGTPDWEHTLGQSSPLFLLKEDGCSEIINGLVYNIKDPVNFLYGTGGNNYDTEIVSVFEKVNVKVYNSELKTTSLHIINKPFIIILVKQNSGVHVNRRLLKFSNGFIYDNINNTDFYDSINEIIPNPWFAYKIEYDNKNTGVLTLTIIQAPLSYPIVGKPDVRYIDKDTRKNVWEGLINEYSEIFEPEIVNNNLVNYLTSDKINQKIYFGSPGTGKSRVLNIETKGFKRTRITFHPETDYHSFVGSYKPVMEGINIKYDFVAQAFTKAYCNAWLHPSEPYYLIIEEINRGNCAQIFGDIFQCLDRDNTGKSEYGIDCDKDLAKYLKEKFEKDASPEILENYKNVIESEDFDKIILPSNLYIYATMNTSDQSLFPMDSAFKRRWDMKFIPVDYEDANSLIISLDDDTVYNWGNFIFNINPKIKELTGSEDKQLGNRFINPSDGKITFEQFRSKVLFYLWSEIYKDEVGSLNSIFKYQILEEDPIEFQFGELFEEREGSITQIDLFKGFMHFNGIETISNK